MKTKGTYHIDEFMPIPIRDPYSHFNSSIFSVQYVVGRYVGSSFRIAKFFDHQNEAEKFVICNPSGDYELIEVGVSIKKLI